MEIQVQVQSQIGACEEFMSSPRSGKEAVSVVISPLKVVTSEQDTSVRVTSGCNLWQACYNKRCHFSCEARKGPRIG